MNLIQSFYQCAPIHIEDAIKILRDIKKKYGEIPICSHNGEGIHIFVERSDKSLSELSTVFSYKRKKIKEASGVYRHILKKNPTTNYVHIW